MRLKIVVFGKDKLTERQKELLRSYLSSVHRDIVELEIEYMLGEIDRARFDRLYPYGDYTREDAIHVDYAVFEYDITWAIVELLKRGITVLGFLTAKSMDGTGDLFAGKVKTVGLYEYELHYRKKPLVVESAG
ncbi:MAG: hypothetical protein QXY39_01810 [Thermofilaceae archaeon]